MRLKTTNCLFYKTFPYKVVISAEWTAAGQILSEESIDEILKDKKTYGYLEQIVKRNPSQCRKIVRFVRGLDKNLGRVRVERSTMSIFLKDRLMLESVKKEFQHDIYAVYEPKDLDTLNILTSEKKIEIRKYLTYDCRYRVTLKGWDDKTFDVRSKFLDLVERHPDQFFVTKTTIIQLSKPKYGGWGSCYFYVKDEKFLLIAEMMIQPIIKDVFKMITEDELTEGK